MRRVWLVDDSPLAMENAARQLASDYAVECFSDGSSVLERAASAELPDVLVLDWMMPGVSGSEVLGFLRASPRTEGLPILVLTATANGPDLVEALEMGADDYVAKPCSRAELVARVGALVRGKELRERAEAAERRVSELLIRERSAREAAEAANEVKDDFLATLSHELRTPLHSILGWVGLLRGGSLSPATATRALATVERNAKAQASIIEDLLDISRIVSGKLRLEMREMDPSDAAEQACETLRPVAATKNVTLTSRIARVGLVSGDAARVQQIVWNLLSNAIRFTPGGGTVTIDTEHDAGGVRVAVTDTGEGITPELLPRVFDRFKQGDSSSTRAHGGLGLGLAIVRHLAELHGGHVRALSEGRGQGARFEVWLPLLTLTATEDRASVDTSAAVTSLSGLNLLVVDDDLDSLELLSAALAIGGAQVAAATSAEDALGQLSRSVPDVLISDLMMPGMSGYQLVRALRARDASLGGSVPAIALTASAREEDCARALAAGFQVHLAKPVDIGALSTAIARLAQERMHVT